MGDLRSFFSFQPGPIRTDAQNSDMGSETFFVCKGSADAWRKGSFYQMLILRLSVPLSLLFSES